MDVKHPAQDRPVECRVVAADDREIVLQELSLNLFVGSGDPFHRPVVLLDANTNDLKPRRTDVFFRGDFAQGELFAVVGFKVYDDHEFFLF